MIIRFFFEGGPTFMSLVYLMWIIVISLAVRFIILYRGSKNPQKLKKTNDGILFFGSLAFLIGISAQMVGLIQAFDVIQSMGGNSIGPHMLAGGLKVSFIAPFFGMMLLIISSIIWFVYRNLKDYPSNIQTISE
ncbi:MotA/TolQ/ExbB proton channel family protein [Marinifilum flexuosum]|uniref:MotA/TolQ/ExbB proton channel family protein n=1 Tax=Marinifilum flexuosum TaxID=1117708 RepID=A0A419WEZ4_9BACT|nr:MotA/TolQ/ExbB proton channel family protein [Marinifilum flexuosum]RKD94069.1 MotA/TolQ/ExbB proton channel family protein [Marinifilum flexuosum]